MCAFTIRGVVLEAETRRPLAGWYVRAYDTDLIFDDVLGSSVTSDDGTFTIRTELGDFRERFERRPGVCFRLARRPGEEFVHDTERGSAFEGNEPSHHEILVPVAAARPGERREPGGGDVAVPEGGRRRRSRGEGRPG